MKKKLFQVFAEIYKLPQRKKLTLINPISEKPIPEILYITKLRRDFFVRTKTFFGLSFVKCKIIKNLRTFCPQ